MPRGVGYGRFGPGRFNRSFSGVEYTPQTGLQELVGRILAMQLARAEEGRAAERESRAAEALKLQQDREARAAEADARAAEAADLKQQITLADLRRAAAAQTTMADAPKTTAAEAGFPALGPGEGGPTPEEIQVPKRERIEIKLPSGETMDLGPLRYEEEVEAKEKRKRAELFVEGLQQLGLKTELLEGVKSRFRPARAPTTRNLDKGNGLRTYEYNPETGDWDIDIGAATDQQVKAMQAAERQAEKDDKTAEARATALEWAAGRTFPRTQRAQQAAQAYMLANAEEFSKLPVDEDGNTVLPRNLTPQQQKQVLDATTTLDRIDTVWAAFQKVKNKVGPLTYSLHELAVRTPGLKADHDFVTFNTLLRGMGNLEIKRITGAQMSQAEAARLLKGMATGNLRAEDFEAALAIMKYNALLEKQITLFGEAYDVTAPTDAQYATVKSYLEAGGEEGATIGAEDSGVGQTIGKYKIISVE